MDVPVPFHIADVTVDTSLHEANRHDRIELVSGSFVRLSAVHRQSLSVYQRSRSLSLRAADQHLSDKPFREFISGNPARRNIRLKIIRWGLIQFQPLQS